MGDEEGDGGAACGECVESDESDVIEVELGECFVVEVEIMWSKQVVCV